MLGQPVLHHSIAGLVCTEQYAECGGIFTILIHDENECMINNVPTCATTSVHHNANNWHNIPIQKHAHSDATATIANVQMKVYSVLFVQFLHGTIINDTFILPYTTFE